MNVLLQLLLMTTPYLLLGLPVVYGEGPKPPLGLPELIIPEDNPITAEKASLGKRLYFDKRLSFDDTVSCASCHDPARGFSDGLPVSVGIKGQKGTRSAPTTLNAAYLDLQFWDGRAPSLEEQVKQPLVNPVEMGMPSLDAVVEKLKGIPEYKETFEKIFGDITIDSVAMVIASFERTLLSGNSPFDRFFYGGDKKALSKLAQEGLEVFKGKGRCITCHEFIEGYALFTDNKFHNLGVGMEKANPDLGRYIVTKEEKDKGAFKTPSLRNIALTAPYMHDGSEPTLEKVVEFYDDGGRPNPFLSGEMRPLNLSKREKDALVEFLKSLTSNDLPGLVVSLRGF